MSDYKTAVITVLDNIRAAEEMTDPEADRESIEHDNGVLAVVRGLLTEYEGPQLSQEVLDYLNNWVESCK